MKTKQLDLEIERLTMLKNRSGLTEDGIELLNELISIKEQLMLGGVVGRSEQLTCPRCKSTNILNPDKDNDAQCIECAFVWAG